MLGGNRGGSDSCSLGKPRELQFPQGKKSVCLASRQGTPRMACAKRVTRLGDCQELSDNEAMLGKALGRWEPRKKGGPQILGLRSHSATVEKQWRCHTRIYIHR